MTAIICHLGEKIVTELLFSSWNPSSSVVMGTFDKYFVFPLPLPDSYPGWCGNKKTFACAWDTGLLWWKHSCKKAWKRAGSSLKEPKLRAPGPPTSPRLRLWDICFGKFGHFSELISQPQNQECKTEMEQKRKKAKKKAALHQKRENLNDFV